MASRFDAGLAARWRSTLTTRRRGSRSRTSCPDHPSNSLNDFDNAQLSRLRLSPDSGGVIDASLVITSAERFHRFCSSFLGTSEQGFSRDILFTNEEATDFVFRQGQGPEWTQPIPAGMPLAEQTGVVVAYDVASGARKPIYGMGRLNHENSVAIPGRGEIMLVTGDDTFTTNPAQSQVYSYFAKTADEVWNDQGALWGFRAKDWHTYNDYYDFVPGAGTNIEGEFVQIPADAAKGDQTALESASDTAGVFEFVRIEDIAYDRRHPNVVYIADSGRANAANGTGVSYDSAGNRVPTVASFASRNGRIWKMVVDPANPRHVTSLSILIEGDNSRWPARTRRHRSPRSISRTTLNDQGQLADHRGSVQREPVPDRDGEHR